MSAEIVKLCNANSPSGVAYLGGNGCQGFNTEIEAEAHKFSAFDAERFADHFRGWYHGFAGGGAVIRIVAQ